MYDVAIAGLGPSGRALASRCAEAGLRVLAIDPSPDAPWTQTLALWSDQLPVWLDAAVIGTEVGAPTLVARTTRTLDARYAVIDNDRLRAALDLPEDRVTIERAGVSGAGLRALRARAGRVVDCRGARRGPGGHRAPRQTAYGVVLSAEDAAPALGGAAALFMDWSDDASEPDDPADAALGPTFLYAVPLAGGRFLLEETCLAGRPAPEPDALAARLRRRALRRGVPARAFDAPLAVERVRIPLTRSPRRPAKDVFGFGTAGGYGHAATGFSIAASLAAVPAAVWSISRGVPARRPRQYSATALHRLGLHALLAADAETTVDLFEAFASLDGARRLDYLTSATPTYRIAEAMGLMWARMPGDARRAFAAAALLPAGSPAIRR